MIPHWIDKRLAAAPGKAGDYYNAYKSYRWGDPYLKLVAKLAKRDRLSIDVGAHVGDYTSFMRRHSAGCIAYECNPALVARLRARFRTSVDVWAKAVSDTTGETVLRIPQAADGSGLGRATIASDNPLDGNFSGMQTVTVHTVRLDDEVHEPVGFIKLDVEGHELAVLRGASGILTRDRPDILAELEERHAPGCLEQAIAYLAPFGYAPFHLQDRTLTELGDARPSGNFVFASKR